jgi:hypothetical protein
VKEEAMFLLGSRRFRVTTRDRKSDNGSEKRNKLFRVSGYLRMGLCSLN